jgi:hypothetical protein
MATMATVIMSSIIVNPATLRRTVGGIAGRGEVGFMARS